MLNDFENYFKICFKNVTEKSVCLRAVAKATDDLVTRPSSHPLLDNTSPYLHIETLGAISKKILIDPFWDIFFSLSKYN